MGEKVTPEILERLIKIAASLDLSQRQLCIGLGVGSSWLPSLKSGRQNALTDTIMMLLQYKWGVNLDWLLTGEGDMFLPATDNLRMTPDEVEIIERYRQCIDEDKKAIYHFVWGISDKKRNRQKE